MNSGKKFVLHIISDNVATGQNIETGSYKVNITNFLDRFVPDKSVPHYLKVVSFRFNTTTANLDNTLLLRLRGALTMNNTWLIDHDASNPSDRISDVVLQMGGNTTINEVGTTIEIATTNTVLEYNFYSKPVHICYFTGNVLEICLTGIDASSATGIIDNNSFSLLLEFEPICGCDK